MDSITLDKLEQVAHIGWIREPRYNDRTVLIMKRKLSKTAKHFSLKFTDCNSLPETYYIEGKSLRRSKVEHHRDKSGYNEYFVYSLDKLRQLKRTENSRFAI